MYRGYDLESVSKDTWKELNKIARGGDNVLKNDVLNHVLRDYPQFILVTLLT